jgi:acyl-CoA reductase-like NAD-dependent aldehyde dehydrogenase
MIARADNQGAFLAAGGSKPAGLTSGYYLAPTILAGAKPGMEIFDEEIFGPVLAVTPFDSEEEAISLANAGEFDLAGLLRARDDHRPDATFSIEVINSAHAGMTPQAVAQSIADGINAVVAFRRWEF